MSNLFNIEAEEAILGGILIDPEALDRVVDILVVEAFYVISHRHIYQGFLSLQAKNSSIDLMTLSNWLGDRDLLETIGSSPKLASLISCTVSADNIDRYADLVMDKHIRRQLAIAGNEIVQLSQETSEELSCVLDRSEQQIFRLTQARPQKGLAPLNETLVRTFNNIENLSQGLTLPGLPSGYYDLDAMTSGFGYSDLIIVAGRPAMGKTSFSLGVGCNVAREQGKAVAIFSMEMSKEQLTQRLLASEAKIPSDRLRSGRFEEKEYAPLVEAVASLSELPIFIDDSTTLSVNQMRSQLRRIIKNHKQGLGLVLLDYLQLMGGSNSDNRVQELSQISRSLKSLAREFNVPVIALSQLSRAVEQRTNKRPMMSDLRESGSLEQDSDLILMLYRDSYYNPASIDRNLAEVSIVKHRNGPTGTIKLLFQAHLTKFENLATALQT